MTNSHFTDSTGLPDEKHYTTAKDLAVLGAALINDFPQYYHWYKDKWFIYNGIRQPNRNRLLWRNAQVDGIKTGHTNDAGFCLVASAKRSSMRLLSVVMGAPSDSVRADDSERLLNYGFRFFESHRMYTARQVIATLPLYKGETKTLKAGVIRDQFITIPNGQYQRISVDARIPKEMIAPIKRDQQVGELLVRFDDKLIETYPLYALDDVPAAGFFTRSRDAIVLLFKHWFS